MKKRYLAVLLMHLLLLTGCGASNSDESSQGTGEHIDDSVVSTDIDYSDTGLTTTYSNGSYSITGCDKNKKEITIPSTWNDGTNPAGKVTSISKDAFKDCHSLTYLSIPESVTSISRSAFEGCASLKELALPSLFNQCLGYYFGAKSYFYNADYVPQTLERVVLKGGDVPVCAFYKCSSIVSIALPDSVSTFGYYACFGCTSLFSLIIPDGTTGISDYSFENCSSLSYVVIPRSVTSIELNAFEGCSNLTSIYYKGSASDWKNVSVKDGNASLDSAVVYCYCESKPSGQGDYWHYDNGVPVVW